MSVDFAEEAGSLIITVEEDGEGPVEVVYDDNATVIVTLVGGNIADVQIIFGKKAAERLAKALREEKS